MKAVSLNYKIIVEVQYIICFIVIVKSLTYLLSNTCTFSVSLAQGLEIYIYIYWLIELCG